MIALTKLHEDNAFSFEDSLKRKGVCRLQVFRRGVVYLVAFTELKSNVGPSITNSIESLIKIIQDAISQWSLKQEDKDDLVILYLERYEDHPEYFDWVQLGSNGQPVWTRAKDEEIKAILPNLDAR